MVHYKRQEISPKYNLKSDRRLTVAFITSILTQLLLDFIRRAERCGFLPPNHHHCCLRRPRSYRQESYKQPSCHFQLYNRQLQSDANDASALSSLSKLKRSPAKHRFRKIRDCLRADYVVIKVNFLGNALLLVICGSFRIKDWISSLANTCICGIIEQEHTSIPINTQRPVLLASRLCFLQPIFLRSEFRHLAIVLTKLIPDSQIVNIAPNTRGPQALHVCRALALMIPIIFAYSSASLSLPSGTSQLELPNQMSPALQNF